MTLTKGMSVVVAHGVSGWAGIVIATQPGYVTVGYPYGDKPGDQYPTRELIDLSKHNVRVVA